MSECECFFKQKYYLIVRGLEWNGVYFIKIILINIITETLV